MKKRLIYSIISTISVIIGAFFFSNPFDSGSEPQTQGITDDATFVNLVRTSTIMFTDASDESVVMTARGVCTKLDQGLTGEQVRQTLIISSDPTIIKDSEFMMSASIAQYCTKHSGVAAKYVNR